MSLPTGSKLVDYLNSIIDEKGWSKDSPDILNEVASYIRNCAKYTLDFDSNIYKQEDMVYAFLTIYKQGICQHFAAAGTLMFRALGFPARYVTGMVATVKANVLTEVKNTQGHAWVEVYLDGKGWVPVEVTGGGPGTDDGDDNNGRTALTITPVTTYAQYTNQTIYPKQEVMGLSKLKGYTYDVDISGEKSSAGTWTTNIESFVLYDADGNDVTNEFAITYKVGKLQIYYSIIEVTTISMEKMYDGKPLTCSTQPTYTGGLMPGHKITFKMTASVTDVDLSNVTKNTTEVNIIDENNGNANVTGQYKIVKKFGTLTITRRTIKIITASDSRVYNGTALVCHERQLEGSLADGDELSITFTGSQTEVGSSENTAIVKVLRNGVNVTSNYNISTQRGTLTVTAPKDI